MLEEGAKEDNIQASFWPTPPLAVLADAYRLVGNTSLAVETIFRALNMARKRDERGFEAWSMLVMAMVKIDEEKPSESKEWYLRTLQQATNLSMRPLVAHCHNGIAIAHLMLGDMEAAELANETAIDLYKSLGMTFWLANSKM